MVLGAITGVPTPACLSAASNPVEAVTPPLWVLAKTMHCGTQRTDFSITLSGSGADAWVARLGRVGGEIAGPSVIACRFCGVASIARSEHAGCGGEVRRRRC